MAITGPAHAQDLLSLLRSREAAPEIRQFAAKGVLPLESDDRMRALFAVLQDPDPAIAATARATLAEFPPDDFADFLREPRLAPEEIDAVASLTDDVIVLEQVVRHRNVSDSTLLGLARTVTGAAQEALIVNQVRLLRNPALIEALFSNPSLAPEGRRMLNELKEEFFEKAVRRRQRKAASPKPVREPTGDTELESEDEAEEEAETAPSDSGSTSDSAAPPRRGMEELYLKILAMSVPERVKLALTGTQDERRFLIADSSRMVGFAVLRARGLTITEVEVFCQMRHLEPDIFHKIAAKRDWIRRPPIILALVKNPKVPLTITLPLIGRLPLREMRNISRDRNLSEAVRATAKKMYLQRRK